MATAGPVRVPDVTAAGLSRFLEHRIRSTPALLRSVLITGAVRPLFYLLLLGLGLGALIDGRDAAVAGMEGGYLAFVGPGLLAASAVEWAFGQGLWPTSGSLRWEGRYKAAAVTPTSSDEITTGHFLWEAGRFGTAAIAFTIVLAGFGIVQSPLAVFAPLAAALTVLSILTWVAAYAASTDGTQHFPVFLRLGMIPMFLFSGAFFPLDGLPTPITAAAQLSPGYHGVELCRDLIQGTVSAGLNGTVGHVLFLMVLAVTGWQVSLRTFDAVLAGDRP